MAGTAASILSVLALGMRDRARVQRVGDHHPPRKRAQQAHDRRRAVGGLERHLIIGSQLPAEDDHRVPREIDPSSRWCQRHRHLKQLGDAG
ncbi:MAG TPA: hypothetical protein VE684_22735 [Crenalkalicoccus sp.]|nr:hypothetical protein [Crenalkalicoccus sp.]